MNAGDLTRFLVIANFTVNATERIFTILYKQFLLFTKEQSQVVKQLATWRL